MEKYKVGDINTIKIEDHGVLIFQYLGRGLNGYLKLREGDKYVELSENGELVGYSDFSDKENEYRRIIGKYIHSYGIEDVWDIKAFNGEFIHECDSTTVGSHIELWLRDSQIPHEDFIKLFNPDMDVISELVDKYTPLPIDKKVKKNAMEFTEDGYPAPVVFH